jgi:hypothetical protein
VEDRELLIARDLGSSNGNIHTLLSLAVLVLVSLI